MADQKIANGSLNARHGAPWKTMREVGEAFQAVRERVGEAVWREQVERCGWREYQDIRNAMDSRDAATKAMAKEKATDLYWQLDALARQEGK